MYSRPSDSRPLSFIYIEDDGSWCTTNSDRYMRINMGKCRENKDSQMECPAMADWGTSNDSSAGKLAGFLDVSSLNAPPLSFSGEERFVTTLKTAV